MIRESLVWLSYVALLNGHRMIGVTIVSFEMSGVDIHWVQNGLLFFGKSSIHELHHG